MTDLKVIEHGIIFTNPRYGIFYICPPHWVAEDLKITLDQMFAYMHEHGLTLTHFKGKGYGITNLEIDELEDAFGNGGSHE